MSETSDSPLDTLKRLRSDIELAARAYTQEDLVTVQRAFTLAGDRAAKLEPLLSALLPADENDSSAMGRALMHVKCMSAMTLLARLASADWLDENGEEALEVIGKVREHVRAARLFSSVWVVPARIAAAVMETEVLVDALHTRLSEPTPTSRSGSVRDAVLGAHDAAAVATGLLISGQTVSIS